MLVIKLLERYVVRDHEFKN